MKVILLFLCLLVCTSGGTAQIRSWTNPFADSSKVWIDACASGSQIVSCTKRGVALYDINSFSPLRVIPFDSSYAALTAKYPNVLDIFLDTNASRVGILVTDGPYAGPSISGGASHTRFVVYSLLNASWDVDSSTGDYPSNGSLIGHVDHQYRHAVLGGFHFYLDSQPAYHSDGYGVIYYPERSPAQRKSNVLLSTIPVRYRPDLKYGISWAANFWGQISGHSTGTTVDYLFIQSDSAGGRTEIPRAYGNQVQSISDDARCVQYENSMYDWVTRIHVRQTPKGCLVGDRFMLCLSDSGRALQWFDVQEARYADTLARFSSAVKNYFLCNDRSKIIACTRDFVYAIPLPRLGNLGMSVHMRCSTTSPNIGDTVRFTNLAYPVSVGRYVWTFGDGTSDTSRSSTHHYRSGGSYRVRLGVVLAIGDTAWDTDNTMIYVKNIASLRAYQRFSKGPITALSYDSAHHRFLVSTDSGRVYSLQALDGQSRLFAPETDKRTVATAAVMMPDQSTLLRFTKSRTDSVFIMGRNMYSSCYASKTFDNIAMEDTSTHSLSTLARTRCYDTYDGGSLDNTLWYITRYDTIVSSPNICFSPNKQWLLVASNYRSYTLRRYDQKTDRDIRYSGVLMHTGNLYRYKLGSPSASYRENKAGIDSTYGYFMYLVYDSTSRAVYSVCINQASTRYLATENVDMVTSRSASLLIEYDLQSGAELRRWNDSSNCVRYTLDGTGYISASGIHNLVDGSLTKPLSFGNPRQFELLPNKYHLLVMGDDSVLASIWNTESGSATERFIVPSKKARCMALSHDASILAVGTSDGSVYLFNMPNYIANPVQEHLDPSPDFSISPNPAQDKLLFVSSEAADYRITELCGRELIRESCSQGGASIDVSSLANGTYLLQAQMGGFWKTKVFVVLR